MFGSGHMLKYMRRRGNLTKYYQQGWEALNTLIKLFFFRRTNKGGSLSEIKGKLIPIGQLMQRIFFWIHNFVPDQLWDSNYDIDEDTNYYYNDMIFSDNVNNN